jgi:protease-4
MHFADVQELMRKIGIGSSVVKSGKFKDIGSPVRDMTEEEKMLIQQMVDDVYDQMLVVIADRRKMDREHLLRIADGRIMTGRQAQQAGLVDHMGNQRFAVRLAAKMAGIEGEPEAVYPVRKKAFLRDFLLESLALSFKRVLLQNGQKTDGLKYLFRAE